MKRLLTFYWQVFGYPDIPPKFILWRAIRIYKPRAYEMNRRYLIGCSLEEIAKQYNVTRERVRQCLWKVYRSV